MVRVALVSDTHGLLRPEVLAGIAGVDHVIHAGDIGHPGIVDALAAVAPLSIVRGNNDVFGWDETPWHVDVTLGRVAIHLVHDIVEARPGGARVVVCGHSHAPDVTERGGRLWVNPGSCGPRRFRLPISYGVMTIDAGEVAVELRTLG
jgi:putative phosphoesterase